MVRAQFTGGALALGVVLAASCRPATELTVHVTTDVRCADLRGSSVTVGRVGEVDGKPATTSSELCDGSGDLGTLVVVPSGDKSEQVAIKVVVGIQRDASTCVPPYGKGCIVARRAIRYLPHTGLTISVPMRIDCDGIPCGATETCVHGQCVSAQIADPSVCEGPVGCGDEALAPPGTPTPPPPPPPDAGPPIEAGVDAGATVYNDITNPAFWTTVDLAPLNVKTGSAGVAFDGRYLSFMPNEANPGHGYVPRYDTQGPLGAASSWSTFDTTTVNAQAEESLGTAFDGRYVYVVPTQNSLGYDGAIMRYDSQQPAAGAAAWSAFDVAALNANAKGFAGAAFDKRYIYFVPGTNTVNNILTRYDTSAPFTSGPSWSFFDLQTVYPGTHEYLCAIFDGRYVYLPRLDGTIVRFDTQGSFTSAASYASFDSTTVVAPIYFFTGVFDGRYVYFVPSSLAAGAFSGVVLRYDTQGAYGAAASWSSFDIATLSPNAKGYYGGAFDGRYVYFVPSYSAPVVPQGNVARYDTQGVFSSGAAWSVFDMTTLDPNAKGFETAGFDGKFIYLAPSAGSVVGRFEAKSPPSLPPSFQGSFF